MKQFFLLLLFFVSGIAAHAQLGISYHQSALPFVGINYAIGDLFMPELRLGTDRYLRYLEEDLVVEGVLTYNYLIREEYRLYAGLGFYYNSAAAASVPIGIQLYPFDNKRFGFHIEATPLIGEGTIFRGSWGIRYQFLKE